jgi:ElaA protein
LHEVAGDYLVPAQLYDILRLRLDVFVVEQECPYPEIDGRDLLPDTRHLWVADADGIGSYLRVLQEPAGVRRIGRVCSARDARGRGLAARLMTAALADTGDVDCVLDAQTYAQGFYAKFGFEPEGEEFDEDGIPHITMWRRRPRRMSTSG